MTLPDNQEGPPVDETGSGEVLPRRALDCRQAPLSALLAALTVPTPSTAACRGTAVSAETHRARSVLKRFRSTCFLHGRPAAGHSRCGGGLRAASAVKDPLRWLEERHENIDDRSLYV